MRCKFAFILLLVPFVLSCKVKTTTRAAIYNTVKQVGVDISHSLERELLYMASTDPAKAEDMALKATTMFIEAQELNIAFAEGSNLPEIVQGLMNSANGLYGLLVASGRMRSDDKTMRNIERAISGLSIVAIMACANQDGSVTEPVSLGSKKNWQDWGDDLVTEIRAKAPLAP